MIGVQLGKPCRKSYLKGPESPLDAVKAFEEVFGAQPTMQTFAPEEPDEANSFLGAADNTLSGSPAQFEDVDIDGFYI